MRFEVNINKRLNNFFLSVDFKYVITNKQKKIKQKYYLKGKSNKVIDLLLSYYQEIRKRVLFQKQKLLFALSS